MRNILFPALILFTAGCRNQPVVNVDKIPEEGTMLATWQILGPFTTDSRDSYLDVNNLKQFGFDEATITYGEFAGIAPTDTSQYFLNRLVTSEVVTDFNKVFNLNEKASVGGNVYCMCILKSSRDRKLKLDFTSQDGSKVWLNHRLIHRVDLADELYNYKYYPDIELKKGSNILLVKVNNLNRAWWKLFAAIEYENKEGERKHRRTFSQIFGPDYLKRSLITNDSLWLNETLPAGQYFLSITGQSQKIVTGTISDLLNEALSISMLKKGLYQANLYAMNDTFIQPFYKGDIADTTRKLIGKIRRYKMENPVRQNIDALCFRFDHLQKPGNMGKSISSKREWDKKMISLYRQFDHYYRCFENSLPACKHAPGSFLRSYTSEIDHNLQYYQVHVPEGYNREKACPLFIHLPTIIERHPSFLETQRVADILYFDLLGRKANKYNMIALQPHNRTIGENANTIDEADLWEVIADLKKDYNIDTARIYLSSECQPAEYVIRFAVKYPDRFAAIATLTPRLLIPEIDNPWVQQNEPIHYLKNILNMPFVNFHSRVNPHTPVKHSEEINRLAKQAGLKKFEYRRTFELGIGESDLSMDDVFRFCSRYTLNPSPPEIYFCTSQMKYNKSFWITLNEIVAAKDATVEAKVTDNILTIRKQNVLSYSVDLKYLPFNEDKPLKIIDGGKVIYNGITKARNLTFYPLPENVPVKNKFIEGPLAHVFTRSFILVPGTRGDKAENAKIQAMADTINRYWILRYFGGCRIKPDHAVTQDDIEESNLVLLGSPGSNTILAKITGKLPIAISDTAISIGNRVVKGRRLSCYAIYPNPLNPKRYVAIIGYNNPDNFSPGYEDYGAHRFDDVSNYGWYDYKVWNSLNPEDILLSGYFNSRWEINEK